MGAFDWGAFVCATTIKVAFYIKNAHWKEVVRKLGKIQFTNESVLELFNLEKETFSLRHEWL